MNADSKRCSFLPLLIGGFVAAVLLYWWFAGKNTQFEDVGLGLGTSSYFGKIAGAPIHGGPYETISEVWEGWKSRGENPVILWLGNSQLHGVNQFKAGDQNAPFLVHGALAPKGFEVLCFSIPNANLGEHLMMFCHLAQAFPV